MNTHQQPINYTALGGPLAIAAMGGAAGAVLGAGLMTSSIGKITDDIISHVSSFGKRGDLTITYSIRY
jgi:hypothetical protein